MILRLWRGETAPDRTEAYRRLLTGEIAPAILARGVPGLRELGGGARDPRELDPAAAGETLTVMTVADWAAVAAFTGGDPSASVVPPAARRLLARFDEHSRHDQRLATFGERG